MPYACSDRITLALPVDSITDDQNRYIVKRVVSFRSRGRKPAPADRWREPLRKSIDETLDAVIGDAIRLSWSDSVAVIAA